MQKIHHVFVSSTYTDLVDERRKVSEAVAKAGYVAEGMEIFPASSQQQFEFIKRIIDRCDYYILIIGGRYGSIYDEDRSYTRAEFEYAQSRGIPTLSLLRKSLDQLSDDKQEHDPELRDKLFEFREFVETTSLVDYWDTPDEAGMKAIAALSQEVIANPGIGWIRGDSAAGADVLAELNELRKANAALKSEIESQSMSGSVRSVAHDVAGLDDVYLYIGELSSSRYANRAVNENFTWRQVLSIIGPEYRTHSNVIGAHNSLKRYFKRTVGDSYNLTYDKDTLVKILMQFEVLGLMVAKELPLQNGGSGLFYKLTNVGLAALLESAASKKSTTG